jgi:hypothetical protein
LRTKEKPTSVPAAQENSTRSPRHPFHAQRIGDTSGGLKAIQDLIEKRLVGWSGENLVFLTRRCATAISPRGDFVAADMENERLFEWMMRDKRWKRSTTQEKPTS